MRILIGLIVVLLSVPTLASTICTSVEKSELEGVQELAIRFDVVSDQAIQNVVLALRDPRSGEYHPILSQSGCSADPKYNPTNPKAQMFSRFDLKQNSLDDYDLFLPKNVSQLRTYTGYLQVSFDHGRPITRPMHCQASN